MSFLYTIANEELVLFWIWIELKFVRPHLHDFEILVIVIGPSRVQFKEFGLDRREYACRPNWTTRSLITNYS